jgi:hypothetical protein
MLPAHQLFTKRNFRIAVDFIRVFAVILIWRQRPIFSVARLETFEWRA